MFPLLLPEMAPYRDRYAGLTGSPLRVRAVLREHSPMGAYDPVHLDNLLARCVVDEATQGAGVAGADRAYALPVPLHCLWRSEFDLPLWASTGFVPVETAVDDTVYLHKRAQSGRFTHTKSGRLDIRTTSGRYMERRVPVPVTVCGAWEACCWGDGEEIARLLRGIAHLGKHRNKGWGDVREWQITPLPELVSPEALLVDAAGRLARPLPMGAAHLLPQPPQGNLALVGWTPPPWKPDLFAAGWRMGTPLCGR